MSIGAVSEVEAIVKPIGAGFPRRAARSPERGLAGHEVAGQSPDK
jgi:hypothetical protein